MKANSNKLIILFILTATLFACGSPTGNSEIPVEEPAQPVDLPQSTAIPPTEIAIQHEISPVNLPGQQSGRAGDFDSSAVSENGAIGGDRFTFGRFERPFNANTMDVYFSQIDIVDTSVYQDGTWLFGSITVKGADASNSLSGKYAIEIDTNLDGKGDWLIIASNPSAIDWTVENVQVYEDTNNDVGSELPMLTDENPTQGDGFETLIFDQGQGSDPDAAWARISPNNSSTVEIAVKLATLGNSQKYLINMWAGNSLLDPSLFDLNDRFTHEQAGAADISLEFFYPIKEVYEIDNSCRMAIGFQPTGQEAGLCEAFRPVAPGEPNPPLACTLTSNDCPHGIDAENCVCYPAPQ